MSLEAATSRFRDALRGREDDAISRMQNAYSGVQSKLNENLTELAAKMRAAEAAGETISPGWLAQEKRYRQLLQQVEDELLTLGEGQTPHLTDAQSGVVDLAEQHAPEMARLALGTPPDGVLVEWNALPRQTLESLVGFASDGSPVGDIFDEWGEDIAKTLRQEIVTAAALGQGADAIARRMYALIGDPDPETGSKGIALHRAENIVRTELHRAARTASRDLYAQNADTLDGWVWGASCDDRCCACCWAMHGSLHPLSETLDGHPSCRCVMIPRTKSWADITGDPSLPDTRPVIEEGAAKFAALSDETQKSILGPEWYRRYKDGEIALADCVTQTHDARWGSMRRVATLTEAEQNAASRS